MATIVILSGAKNLMDSGTHVFEILRLTPQNDVVGQPHNGLIKRFVTRPGIINSCRPDDEIENGLNLPQEVTYSTYSVLRYVEHISVSGFDVLAHISFI